MLFLARAARTARVGRHARSPGRAQEHCLGAWRGRARAAAPRGVSSTTLAPEVRSQSPSAKIHASTYLFAALSLTWRCACTLRTYTRMACPARCDLRGCVSALLDVGPRDEEACEEHALAYDSACGDRTSSTVLTTLPVPVTQRTRRAGSQLQILRIMA